MGLDQYALVREPGEEIMYWRKHNRLQGWMADLYQEKTGEVDMNCRDLRLEEKDIDNLEQAIKDRGLKEATCKAYGVQVEKDNNSIFKHIYQFLFKRN